MHNFAKSERFEQQREQQGSGTLFFRGILGNFGKGVMQLYCFGFLQGLVFIATAKSLEGVVSVPHTKVIKKMYREKENKSVGNNLVCFESLFLCCL